MSHVLLLVFLKFSVDALEKHLCVTEWILPSHVFIGVNIGCSSDEEKKLCWYSQRAVTFDWLLYKYSHLQVLTMLVYLTVLNTIQMKLYSLRKELTVLLHDQRQQSATNAAPKQHRSVWSVLVWPLKQPDCCQIILGLMQLKRES